MSFKRYAVLVGLSVVTGAYAQISTINSVVMQERVLHNDVPGATYSQINSYPTFVAQTESGVSAPTGFANGDRWQFSANSTTPYQFAPNDYFSVSMDLNVTGTPATPRKEGGFMFNTGSSGTIQFFVDTDAHEVVQIGGISFYSFNTSQGITYNSGQSISLGMTYFLDSNNKNALVFVANGVASPVFEFGPTVGNGALDIGTGSTLGGYFQVANDPSNPSNGGSALFSNIKVTNAPEPTVFAILGGGLLALLIFRRRQ